MHKRQKGAKSCVTVDYPLYINSAHFIFRTATRQKQDFILSHSFSPKNLFFFFPSVDYEISPEKSKLNKWVK